VSSDLPPVPTDATRESLWAELVAQREVNARLREVINAQGMKVESLMSRVEALERRLGRDSSNSGKPPSSDPIFGKGRDRSLRQAGKRRPGKQPGGDSATMKLVENPDATVPCPPSECAGCGGGLADAPVSGVQRRQVTEAQVPPPPRVIEYVVQAKECGRCGVTTVGEPPAHVSGRARFGPETHALAANLLVGHHVPVTRSTILLMQMAGVVTSTGWMASVRGKAAALLAGGGFVGRVRDLLRTAPAVHADETPARAAGKLAYVHVACTRYLTLMHTGGRSADDIDAGGVLPGYTGVIVRDGYAGYSHLSDAAHAWCGAHLLRELKDLYEFEPAAQTWAKDMAGPLCEANHAARAARAEGKTVLAEAVLTALVARYRALTSEGFTANYRTTPAATDAVRLSRRFRDYEDMILRFAANPGTVEFTNNQAERSIRPVKVQIRSSGGCWRTLQGLADFALVHSYLSTAAKWGLDQLDALRRLFTTGPWLPPALAPPQTARTRPPHTAISG
jgi:transposase